MVERLLRKQKVAGSIPVVGFLYTFATPRHKKKFYVSVGCQVSLARLAQLVERQPFKLVVVGSSPTVGG